LWLLANWGRYLLHSRSGRARNNFASNDLLSSPLPVCAHARAAPPTISLPPGLHLHAPAPAMRAAGVIESTDTPSELVAPAGIGDIGADNWTTEEKIPQRYLRRDRQLVELVAGGLPRVVHIIHACLECQTEVFVEMNDGPHAPGQPLAASKRAAVIGVLIHNGGTDGEMFVRLDDQVLGETKAPGTRIVRQNERAVGGAERLEAGGEALGSAVADLNRDLVDAVFIKETVGRVDEGQGQAMRIGSFDARGVATASLVGINGGYLSFAEWQRDVVQAQIHVLFAEAGFV